MPRRARQQSETGVHHVMLRGVNRDSIFIEDGDRVRFLGALRAVSETTTLRVLAYCLMTNHVHLVVSTGSGALIGDPLQRLGVRYAGWFNRKYERVGHLFQDRFRSRPVNDDAYLINVVRYVWCNPVQAGLVRDPTEYEWNSCSPTRPSGLVDDALLKGFLSASAVMELSAPAPLTARRPPGPQRRYSAAQAAQLLEGACGAAAPTQFLALSSATQRGAIRELRSRSVPYSAIADVTGLSATTVRRMQASDAS